MPSSSLLVALALAASAVPRSLAANGPGSYAHYTWPKDAPTTATGMTQRHIWFTMPNATETHGNAVFTSTQFWWEAAGVGGYMGTQAWRQADGTMTHRALFSCWDASPPVITGWVAGAPGFCERFGGEGVGSHCIIEFTLEQGVAYDVTVSLAGHNASGAMWAGTITNNATGATTPIGTLFYPNYDATFVGYGAMKLEAADFQVREAGGCVCADWLSGYLPSQRACSASFPSVDLAPTLVFNCCHSPPRQEYFEADGCENQAVAAVAVIGPQMWQPNGSYVSPVGATGSYVAGCQYENVQGCMPGGSGSWRCGSPIVMLSGGGRTNMSVPAGTQLWG